MIRLLVLRGPLELARNRCSRWALIDTGRASSSLTSTPAGVIPGSLRTAVPALWAMERHALTIGPAAGSRAWPVLPPVVTAILPPAATGPDRAARP